MKDYHIVYEDNHLLIVNKRAGILVQGDSTGDVTLTDVLKDYIKEKYQKPGAVFLHPVHRLDRPVSGLVIFARTSKALERMMEMFRKRDIQKTYWAVTRLDDHGQRLHQGAQVEIGGNNRYQQVCARCFYGDEPAVA